MSTNRAFEDDADESNISLANTTTRRSNGVLPTISRSTTSDEVRAPFNPNNESTQLNSNDFSTYFSDAKIQIPEHEQVTF